MDIGGGLPPGDGDEGTLAEPVMSMTLLATMLFTMNSPMVVCKTSVGLRGRVTFVTKIGDTLALARHSVNCDLMLAIPIHR